MKSIRQLIFYIVTILSYNHAIYSMQWLKKGIETQRASSTRIKVKKQWNPISIATNQQALFNKSYTDKNFNAIKYWIYNPLKKMLAKNNFFEEEPLNLSLINQIYERIKGTSFEEQKKINTTHNVNTLWKIVYEKLIAQDWFYTNETVETLKRFKSYINSEDFNQKTIIQTALEEFLQLNAIKTILQNSKTTEEAANKIYSLLFPPYYKNGEYGPRNALDDKRKNILLYIDQLIAMGGSLGNNSTEKLRAILKTKYIIEALLEKSENKMHKRISNFKEDTTDVKEIFTSITSILERIYKNKDLKKTDLIFETLDTQARLEAQKELERLHMLDQIHKNIALKKEL